MKNRLAIIFSGLPILGLAISLAASGQSGLFLEQLSEKEALQHARRLVSPGAVHSPNGQNIDVVQYRCHWWINPANDSIRGKVAVVFKPKSGPVPTVTLDLANTFRVESVRFRNNLITHSFTGPSTLSIALGASSLQPGQLDSVVIQYRGRPVSTGLGSFFRSLHAGVPIVYTLSEPYGARDWWPCKEALNDKADSLDFTFYTPAPNRVVSNGLLVAQSESPAGIRTYRWKHKYPIATYLIAFAATNYSHFRQNAVLSSGDTLPVDNYCYPENLSEWQTGMTPIVELIQDFDTLLTPYPFPKEKYAHAQFAFGGGMEHQTISFMQNTNLGLQAHELVHHWFGNKVTCGSMREIWLNEGFATYFAALEYVKAGLSTWPQEGKQWINFITQEPGGSVYCPDTSDVYRIFSGRLSYAKGAMLLRMLRWQIGDAAYWNALRQYLQSPQLAYGFARTSDLKEFLELTSGQNLTEFFNDWYLGQGYPIYAVNATRGNGNLVTLTLNQTQSHPSVSFFEGKIPFRLAGAGHDTLVWAWHTQNGQSFDFHPGFTVDTVQFDPESVLLARSNVNFLITENHHRKLLQDIRILQNPWERKLRLVGIQGTCELKFNSLQGQGLGSFKASEESPIVDLSGFPPGVYPVEIRNAGTRKVIKVQLW